MRANFNGLATSTLVNSAVTFDCGVSDLEIVASSGGSTISFNGLALEAGIDPGVAAPAKVLDSQLQVDDASYFSLDDVTLSKEHPC